MGADGPASEKRAAIPPPPLPVRRRRLRASAGPPSEGVTDPATWLLRQSHPIEDVGDILDGLCWRLVQGGVPLTYVHAATPTLHPQLLALACRWWRAAGIIDEFEIDLAAETSEIFLASPFRAILLDGVPRRFRLETGQGRDQVLLRSLTEFGTTDLLVLPMTPISAHFPFVVWGTDVQGGFTDQQVTMLEEVMPPLSAIFETRLVRRIMRDLLEVYLGREAGPKVLAGAIRRGRGERRKAVIMAVDLRSSTWLSDHLPGETMIELLDACFERICQPILVEGGDVLKFIGDGVLAVFPVGDDAAVAARSALKAATTALADLALMAPDWPQLSLPSPLAGVGIHLGDVFYGNVGAAGRLDFTVIGPAVNLAFRIEGLTKVLGRPLLLSREVAALTAPSPQALGRHPVRGLEEPIEIFAPAPDGMEG